ncbi:S-adenosyl-L-methionine-dependent methyltransferase [Kalaharituber pfeilii]|nr:S-adenosyl-L-methionine-dependent methyltransferase [Kalaharituber pfeilii]
MVDIEAYIDLSHINRLDLTHKIFLLLLNGALHWAPIGNDPKRILDIGTGTGIWVIDMAEKYPNATVIGTDVLKIQSERLRYPQNASFVIFDAEATWPWLEKFDFMHTRCLAGALADWEKFIAQAFHNLKPGGYIELHEYSTEVFSPDPSISPAIHAPTIFQWAQLFNQASTLSGRPPGNIITPRLKHELAAAGFVDIEERPLMLPLGVWHPERRMKELGAYGLLNMLDGVEGFTLRLFTRYLGWTDEQCKILIDKVRKEFKRGAKLYVLE